MGSSQSVESIQEQVSSSLSENINKVFNKKVNASTSTVSGTNYVRIEIGPKAIVNCNIDVTQKQVIDNKTFSFFKNMDESTLKTDIKEALKNSLASDQKSESASLSLVPYNKQDSATKQKVTQTVKKVVENIIENSTLNTCTNTFEAGNTFVLPIYGKLNCDKGGGIKVTQELLLKNAADCVSDTIVKQMFENKQISDLAANVVSSQSITVNQWGAIIGLAIIGIVILVLVYAYMKSKDPSQYAGMLGTGVGSGGGPPIFYGSPPPPAYEYPREGYSTGFRFKFY